VLSCSENEMLDFYLLLLLLSRAQMGILLLIYLKEHAFLKGDLAWVNFVSPRCLSPLFLSLFWLWYAKLPRKEFKSHSLIILI